MFQLFYAAVGPEAENLEWLYREVFREQPIRIGTPRSDTCTTCDRIFVEMSKLDEAVPDQKIQLETLQDQSMAHHMDADSSYTALKADCNRSKDARDFVTICVDLQAVSVKKYSSMFSDYSNVYGFLTQVYSLPELTNSLHYYKRKFNVLNLGIFDAYSEDTTMCVWTQMDAGRGSEEVLSCVLKYFRNNFAALFPNEERTLVIWSDRCVGQNNNFLQILGYRYLISSRLFTNVNQTHNYTFTFKIHKWSYICRSL